LPGVSVMLVHIFFLRAQNVNPRIARLPFPLHLAMVKDASSVPARQQRLGVSEVWSIEDELEKGTKKEPGNIMNESARKTFDWTS
jgi:hypothetical protein